MEHTAFEVSLQRSASVVKLELSLPTSPASDSTIVPSSEADKHGARRFLSKSKNRT